MVFQIAPMGSGPRMVAGAVPVYEGTYAGGFYQLVKTDLRQTDAELRIPPEFHDPAFLAGHSHKLSAGLMLEAEKGPVLEAGKRFQPAGKAELERFFNENGSRVLFASDATNNPFNEGHFAIINGRMLPLPAGSQPIKGRHYIMSIRNGTISFPVIDTERPEDVASVRSGFFVPKIIDNTRPIRLLDPVPGTGNISISDFRGHIGQIFAEDEYSERGSQKRVDIHMQLMACLRDPKTYYETLRRIVQGLSVDLTGIPNAVLPRQIYNHTYWIETMDGKVYCLKTYPDPEGKPAGVTFEEGPHLLFAVARTYDFMIRDAYIGTNGRDVRMIVSEDGVPKPIDKSADGSYSIGKYLERSLSNFIAFSRKEKGK